MMAHEEAVRTCDKDERLRDDNDLGYMIMCSRCGPLAR